MLEYGVNDDNILIRATAPCVEDENNPYCVDNKVSSNTYIELTSEVFPAELDVENLVINIAPDTLIIITFIGDTKVTNHYLIPDKV